MGAIASQITSLTIVYSAVYWDADQRKLQSSVSLAFVRGIHRGPVNSLQKWPVTRKRFPFDDGIMYNQFVTDSHPLSVRDKWGKFSECKIWGLFHWQFLLVFQIRWGVHHQIATNVCTGHDTTAVALFPKCCSDHMVRIEVKAKRNFHIKFELWWKVVSEMGPWSRLCPTEYVHFSVLYCFVLVYHTISYCTVSGIVGYAVC